MKFKIAFLIFSIVAFFCVGAFAKIEPGKAAAAGTQYVGTNFCPEEYIRADKYDKLMIEIDYLKGYAPDPVALKIFKDAISKIVDKPRGIEIVVDDSLTEAQMRATSIYDPFNFRNYFGEGATMTLYIVYNGLPKKPPFGETLPSNSTIFMYPAAIDAYKPMMGRRKDLVWAEVPAAIQIHEFGHLLGLVPGECPDPECVLAGFSAGKVANVAKQILTARHVPYGFCPSCSLKIRDYRAGTRQSDCMKQRGSDKEQPPLPDSKVMEIRTKSDPNDTEALHRLADDYEKKYRFPEAVEAVKKLIQISMKNNGGDKSLEYDSLNVKLAELYGKEGKYPDAFDILDKCLRKKKVTPRAYLVLAALDRDIGRHPEALKAAKRYVSLAPDDSEAYLTLANIYNDMGNLGETEKAYIKAAAYASDKEDALLKLGYFYDSNHNWDKAEKIFRQLSKSPSFNININAFDHLARALLGKGPENEAEALRILVEYKKSLNSKCPEAAALSDLSYLVEERSGDKEKAKRLFAESVEKSPDCVECYVNFFSWHSADPDDLIQRCGKAAELDPKYQAAYDCLAGAYYRKKDYRKAIEYYQKSHKTSQWGNVGTEEVVSYFKIGERDKALSLLNERNKDFWCWITGKKEEDAVICRIMVFTDAGENDLTMEAYKEYTEKFPYGSKGYLFMAMSLADSGKYGDAVGKMKIAISRNPYDNYLYYKLGLYQSKLGKLKDAEKSLKRSVTLSPNNASAMAALGNVYEKEGDKKLAKEMWAKARAYKPNITNADLK